MNSGERFSRLRMLLGEEALLRLSRAHVLVAGLGAVGSFAVEALARSGIGHLRLVDFDHVELSNVNRQLYALDSTENLAKAALAAARVQDINPACLVEGLEMRIQDETLEQLLTPRPDIVVDAIDTLRDKVSLLAYCVTAQIPVVASMGAARRSDPLCVTSGNLAAIEGCPLARQVRKMLRAKDLSWEGLRCVFSTELPARASSAALRERLPQRAMGSSVCVTGVMGLVLAREAMAQLPD
jgi:tRNA A37 threonylcarbamoyladenosine dehydratase